MKSIRSLSLTFDVGPLMEQLDAHPEVWDRHRWRTEHPQSPHREISDIWCRYNAPENIGPRFNDEHEGVWYPATDDIPAVKDLTAQMMDRTQGGQLGAVLITRVPPGKRVYPHVDRGWHAEHHDKLAILVQGNSGQSFCFEDGEHHCEAGDSFQFRNDVPHWVLNPTPEPRITLIICRRAQ